MKRLKYLLFVMVCFCFTGMTAWGQGSPTFNPTYADAALVDTSPNQITYAPNLDLSHGVQITGPAEVTNATQIYVQFESDSLGNTNLSDAKAATGFDLAGGGGSSIPGIVDPPENPNPANLYYPCSGTVQTNSAWLMINYTPGTNMTTVTNRLTLIAVNGNNGATANWALTNLTLTVRPQQAPPPCLEVRFYNSSTNDPGDVYILPTCKGLHGNGFWWSSAGVTNNWTNWMMQTTNMTVTLGDVGVTGTNLQGQAYYSIYTTNFPNAAWFVSYFGGHLKAPTNASGQWDGTTTYGAGPNIAQPTASNTNGLWFGHEWNAFELTLDGNPADVGDTTYINQFAIPMVMRVFSNSYAAAEAGVYTNLDSTGYYKIGGWTNYSLSLLSNVVDQMSAIFSNGIIEDGDGTPVMIVGPSSAGNGALVPPWTSPPFTNNAQNVWPSFSNYFAAAKAAQPGGRHAKIRDYIGLAGSKTSPTYNFYYDFDLTVTASNSLRLDGSIMVSNAPGSAGTFSTNATGLVLEIGQDAGPNDNWASWSIYTAPTPANLTTVHDVRDLTTGEVSGSFTNLSAYSPYAADGLGGTEVMITGSNLLGTVQVAFCGESNALLPATHFTAESDTNLTVYVPYGALSGPLTVTTDNGSGQSAGDFTVTGTVVQAGPTVSPGASSPVITGFSPAGGKPAARVCRISGDWAGIAEGSETGPGGASLVELYNSSFGSAIMGRIAGDLAAGFAFGFINSDVTNGAYQVGGTNQMYGDSPSGAWWGGNEYPEANTNRLAYAAVNTNYSPWGDALYTATVVTYGHPIYDRMKVFSGDYSRAVIQPPVALNNSPNIWMAEIEFFDGMGSISGGGSPGTYTLVYEARAGGTVSGVLTQTVDAGASGTSVTAELADVSVVFDGWSDGVTNNPRTDTSVTADLNVYTIFRSQGGANLEWYAQYGFTPTNSQLWSDLDSEIVPAKGTTLLDEYIADTDPNDTNSLFRVINMTSSVPVVVSFEPAVTDRVYSIRGTPDLIYSNWVAVTGTMSFIGGRQGQYQVDSNAAPMQMYRMEVDLP